MVQNLLLVCIGESKEIPHLLTKFAVQGLEVCSFRGDFHHELTFLCQKPLACICWLLLDEPVWHKVFFFSNLSSRSNAFPAHQNACLAPPNRNDLIFWVKKQVHLWVHELKDLDDGKIQSSKTQNLVTGQLLHWASKLVTSAVKEKENSRVLPSRLVLRGFMKS